MAEFPGSCTQLWKRWNKENTDRWAAESHSFNGGAPWKRSIR